MSKPSSYTVLLFKACLTEWDAKDRLCGVTDLPATPESIAQATRMIHGARELAESRAQMDIILCGPSDTSMQSARILADSGETKIRVIDELRELDLGLWEGVERGNLEERFPTVYAQWLAQPDSIAPPNGESLEMVQERILDALFKGLKKLKSEHPVVGLVLRPYSWAVIKCWLDRCPSSQVWKYLETESSFEAFSLERESMEALRTPRSQIA